MYIAKLINMKKLTAGVLVLVLSSSLAVSNAQQTKKDTVRTQDIEGVVVTALVLKERKNLLDTQLKK